MTATMEIAIPIAALLLGGVSGALVRAWTSKSSDERKAKQEDKTNREQREHEARVERERQVREAVMEYIAEANDVMASTVDIDGVFNMLTDMLGGALGEEDQKVAEKVDFTKQQMQKLRILATTMNTLKALLPNDIYHAAERVYVALDVVIKQTTEPLAKGAATQAAGQTLSDFINTFREYDGLSPITGDDSQKAADDYLNTLKRQVDGYIEDARRVTETAASPK